MAAAVAAQHANDSARAAASGRRRSLDGGAAATPQGGNGGHGHRRQKVPKAVANALWRRDCGESFKGVCAVCDQEVTVHDFEAGHVVSDNHGGAPELHNLRVICPPCNKSCG